MVTHGRIPTENNSAPTNDPVRTGDIHYAIKNAMPMSPLQEFSRPLAGRGGITPPISNLFSYPSSAPTKLKRATPPVNQTTFARFDSLYRVSPSPKWMTCSKIPHREREQHMASPALGQKSSCLAPPTADNSRVAKVLQSTFSSRITSASIELRGKNATNDNGNAVTSNIPQCNLKQTNNLHAPEELSDKGNSHVIKEKSVRTEMERGGEGVIEVIKSKEIKESNPKQDRVVEASSSAEPGRRKGSIMVFQPPEDIEVNGEQQKQDGVVVEANILFGDQNVENDQSDEKDSPKIEFSMTNEELEEEKINSRGIEQQGKGKDTVVVDQNAEGMVENYSSNCMNVVEPPSTHLEQSGERRRRSDSCSSVDLQIVSEGNNSDIGTSALVGEKVEFSSTQIVNRENSPIADRRASLRSAVVSPCVLVSAMQSEKKTVLPKQHGLGKVVLSANRGEVILRDWFVVAVLDENENPTTQEQPVSGNRKKEFKYHLCGDLVTYQSNNNGSRLPPVTSGVILSRQASNLVFTEDGDLYRLEGECGAAREGTDNHNRVWTSDASEAFRSGFPVYWRSTLRQLLLQHDANEIKEEVKSSSTAEDVVEGRKHDLPEIKDRTTVRQHHILPQNQDAGGADTTHHCNNITTRSELPLASVALDEKANPKQQQSSPRQLRPRWQPPPQQEGGQQLKRKLPTTKPKPNPIKQKKKKMNQPQRLPSSSHHIISGSSPVLKQEKTKQQQQLHSTSHLQYTSRPPPPATKRSSPLPSTTRHRSSNIENLVTKQGPPPLMSRKSKNEPMRLALIKKQQMSNPQPSIKTKTMIRSVTPQRASIRKSRSGRHIVSSLEWWKGERLMSMRPGLQGSPVVVIGRGKISEDGSGLNSSSKELKKNALIVKKKKSSSTDGGVTGSGRGNKTTTTTIARVGSIAKAAGSGSSTKQSHKSMRVVVSSSLNRKPHNDDKEIKIKAESTTPVGMKMTCQKQKSSVLHHQKGRIQQMSHHPASGNWTEEQTKALRQSSLTIPPTAHNYWGCIAEAVPGKTAFECQTKHYESVVSSKNASQCTDGNTSSTNGKKRGRHPTAREQFSRYLQNVAGNVDIPSKVLEETSKMNGDDLFQDSSMRMAKKGIKLPQSAGFAAVQVEQKGVSVPVSPSLLGTASSDPGVTRKYMTQLAKAVRGKGGGISSSGLPPSKVLSPAANTITATTGAKRELAAVKKKARQVESEFSSLSPSSVVDSDEAPVIRIGGDIVSNEDELDESDLN